MAVVLQEVAQSGLYRRKRHGCLCYDCWSESILQCNRSRFVRSDRMLSLERRACLKQMPRLLRIYTTFATAYPSSTPTTAKPFIQRCTCSMMAPKKVCPSSFEILIVGSSNLYDQSLQRNFEANVDHVLQPASNPEHAILWESALAAWDSEVVAQRIHLIGESGDAAAEIRNWIDRRVLRVHHKTHRLCF